MKDRLTPRERFGMLCIDETPDRVVNLPLVTAHASQFLSCSVSDYVTDGLAMGKAQVAAWKHYRHDGLSIFSDVGILAEAMGSVYQVRKNDVPILVSPTLSSSGEAAELSLPDPYRSGRLKTYLDALDYCYETEGDIVPVFVYIPAPFTTAAQLRGISDFLKDTIRNSDAAHELLKISTEAALLMIDAVMERCGHPMLVDPLASCSVISPRIFSTFALPYIKKLIEYMHRYDLDTMLHICGKSEIILHEVARTETDLFSFDDTGCSEAAEAIGAKIRLIGNVSPKLLLTGSEDEVRESVKQTVLLLKNNPKGCVISTGCEIPVRTPAENVKEFIKTAGTYGGYW